MGSSACKSLHIKDVNKFVNKIETVADLIRRLQKMPQNMRIVDVQGDHFEDMYIDKEYYSYGHEEDVVVIY